MWCCLTALKNLQKEEPAAHGGLQSIVFLRKEGTDMDESLLTVEEFADRLNVSTRKVYSLIHEGMPVYEVGSHYRIAPSLALEWLASEEAESEDENEPEEIEEDSSEEDDGEED